METRKEYTKFDAAMYRILTTLGVICAAVALIGVAAVPLIAVLTFGFGTINTPTTLFVTLAGIPTASMIGLGCFFWSDSFCKIKNEDIFDPDMIPHANIRPFTR